MDEDAVEGRLGVENGCRAVVTYNGLQSRGVIGASNDDDVSAGKR